jgi:hypothetical protein
MAVSWHLPRVSGMRQCNRMPDGRTPELCLIEKAAEFGEPAVSHAGTPTRALG